MHIFSSIKTIELVNLQSLKIKHLNQSVKSFSINAIPEAFLSGTYC